MMNHKLFWSQSV